jgi:hypothetical protein
MSLFCFVLFENRFKSINTMVLRRPLSDISSTMLFSEFFVSILNMLDHLLGKFNYLTCTWSYTNRADRIPGKPFNLRLC